MIGIYKITNHINGNVYIGQSVEIEKRWENHKTGKCNSHKSLVHKAILKYGIDNFSFTVLIECPIEKLDFFECYYIRYFDSLAPNGYNLCGGGNKHKQVSEVLREIISKGTKLGMNNSEVRKKCSLGGKMHSGKKQKLENVLKRAASNTGKTRSEESKQKMRESAIRRWSK